MRYLVAIFTCLGMAGCGRDQSTEGNAAPASSPARESVSPDGRWVGETSQDRPVKFVVSERAVTSLKLGARLNLDAVCARPGSPVATDYRGGEADVTFGKPVPVTEGTFVASIGLSDVDARVAGEFSDSSATGTIDLQATPASGCSGKDRLTWSAVRQAP